MTEVREIHAANLKKVQDFNDRLAAQVKTMTKSKEELEDRVGKLDAASEVALTRAKSDARNKYQRAKRQWEADEKAAFEKALAARLEGMKKSAADSFGPQLDQLVSERKELIRAKRM